MSTSTDGGTSNEGQSNETPSDHFNNNSGSTTTNTYGSGSTQDTTHKGLRAKITEQIKSAGPRDYEREFFRQPDKASNAQEFMENQNTCYGLRVFVFMPQKSSKLRLGYGIGKFDEGDDEVEDSQLAFVGDRDQFNTNPTMFALPNKKSYEWVDVKQDWNEERYLTFYEDAANKKTFKNRARGRAKEETVPRMAYFPLEATLAVLDTDGSPWEVLKALRRYEEDETSLLQPEHTKFIKKYLIAVMTNGTSEKESQLAIELKPVMSTNSNLARFKKERIEHLLGKAARSPVRQQAAAASSGQPNERMEELMSAVVNLAKTVHESNTTRPTFNHQQEGRQQESVLQVKELKGALAASVMGFTGVTEVHLCKKIWTTLLSSESNMTKRDELLQEMQKWARANSLEIEEDFLLETQFFKDLLAGDFTVGEPVATEHNINRGLTPQWFMPVTAEYKRQKEDDEQAEADTEGTRTLAEKRELQKVAERPPPETLVEFQVLVNTCAAFLFVLFGAGCDLYRKMLGLSTELKSSGSKRVKNLLPVVTIRQWHWEVCMDWRRYFYSRCKMSDFMDGEMPIFPQSMLSSLIQYITRGAEVPNITFPSKWRTSASRPPATYTSPVPPTAPVYNYQLPPPPQVPQPNTFAPQVQDKPTKPRSVSFQLSDLHPALQTPLHEYHNQYKGTVLLTEMCTRSGIVLGELTPHPKEGRNICYRHVLGCCGQGHKCTRKHLTIAEQGAKFCEKLYNQLKKGIAKLLAEPPEAKKSRR